MEVRPWVKNLPHPAIRDQDAPAEPWTERDTDGQILHGQSLICGCPLDSGCTGWHSGS